jgi:hypothetical protein
MNDWYNDPLETPEPPECCDDYMIDFEDGVCICPVCGCRHTPSPDIEPTEDYELD